MRETIINLILGRDDSGLRGKNVRRSICSLFQGDPIFSQHGDSGETIHSYPLIQYRVSRGRGISLYGINEGADVLAEKVYRHLPKSLSISTEHGKAESEVEYEIVSKKLHMSEFPDNLIGRTTWYKTLSPLLLIDRKDRHEAYINASTDDKNSLLQTWLVNNFVNIAHELAIALPERINVSLIDLKQIPVKKKGVEMIGLQGDFATNMRIGNLGIGHFASHGFGVVRKIIV